MIRRGMWTEGQWRSFGRSFRGGREGWLMEGWMGVWVTGGWVDGYSGRREGGPGGTRSIET